VQKQILLYHEFGMFACGAGQTLIAFQERQLSRRSFAIHGIKQEFSASGILSCDKPACEKRNTKANAKAALLPRECFLI